MTVSTNLDKVTATGTSLRRTFSFSPIVIWDSDELEVITQIIATGVETIRTLGTGPTNYSISIPDGGYPATGSIDFPAAGGTLLPATEKIFIRRVEPLRQDVDYESQGGYDSEVLEQSLDQIVAMVIQLQEQADRSLKSPVGTPSTVDHEMPPPVTGSLYLRLKSDLTGWELVELSSTGTSVVSDATPQETALAAGAAGTSDDVSRADHAHLTNAYIKLSADVHNALNFS